MALSDTEQLAELWRNTRNTFHRLRIDAMQEGRDTSLADAYNEDLILTVDNIAHLPSFKRRRLLEQSIDTMMQFIDGTLISPLQWELKKTTTWLPEVPMNGEINLDKLEEYCRLFEW